MLYNVPIYREFAGLAHGTARSPDEQAILRFCRLLEGHGLAAQMQALIVEILCQKSWCSRLGR